MNAFPYPTGKHGSSQRGPHPAGLRCLQQRRHGHPARAVPPDIVWHAPGRSQLAGDHQGVDTVLGFFAKTMELTGGNFRVEVHDILANDEHAVGLHTAHAEREGRTLQDNNTLVFHVRDGKVTEVWQYWADQYAADELFA
jgi:ketosteroid isomerase-like protein